MSKLDDKIAQLRKQAESTNPVTKAAAKSVLADCTKRDKQREKMGLPPIYGKALTAREGVTTYDARDHAIGAGK